MENIVLDKLAKQIVAKLEAESHEQRIEFMRRLLNDVSADMIYALDFAFDFQPAKQEMKEVRMDLQGNIVKEME